MKFNLINMIKVFICKILIIIIPNLEAIMMIINYFLYMSTYIIPLIQNNYSEKHMSKSLNSNFLFFIIDEIP